MATQVLVDRQIHEGEQLLACLDAEDIAVPVAFWEYRSEWGEWRLVLASPDVDTLGEFTVYGKLVRLPLDPQFRHRILDRVTLARMTDPRVQAFRQSRWIEVGGEGVWIGRSAVGRVFFEDAYLYRAR